MPKVSVKGRSGRLKKTSDNQRTRTFKDRHENALFKDRHASLPSANDDPLGNSNTNILMLIQNSR